MNGITSPGAALSPEPNTEIKGELNDLKLSTDRLLQTIDRMKSRLKPVLLERDQLPKEGIEKPPPPATELGKVLREIGSQINLATQRIREITREVQL